MKEHTSVVRVLTYAKENNQWVAVEHLAPHGLHLSLVYLLENLGLVITDNTKERRIKLTRKGYKEFTTLEGGIQP